jgi:hypothetical protein
MSLEKKGHICLDVPWRSKEENTYISIKSPGRTMDIQTKIHTGSWTLYYHSSTENRWTPDSYTRVCTVETFEQFFAAMNALGSVSVEFGMLFWMRGSITPLYENRENIKGGSYSARVSRARSVYYFTMYALASMIGGVVAEAEDNIVNGVSITPKKVSDKSQSYNVIRVWNRDCSKYNKAAQLVRLDGIQAVSEILYTPHIQRNL